MYFELEYPRCKNRCREESFTYVCNKCGTSQTAFSFIIGDTPLLITVELSCIVCDTEFKNNYSFVNKKKNEQYY